MPVTSKSIFISSFKSVLVLVLTLGLSLQALASDETLLEHNKTFQQALDAAQNNELDKALKIWQKQAEAGNLIPELSRAVENNIAVILIKQKRYDEAKKRLDLALESDAQVATTLANLNQIYAYEAQKAYQKVFKKTKVSQPQAEWLYFDLKKAQLPSEGVITDAESANSIRLIKTQLEQWRQAWTNQNVKRYLSFYDSKAFIPKDGLNYKTWEKGRYRSLQRPKYIKVFVDDVQVTPISETMIRSRFLQRYQSDRFKDDVYKVLLWQKYAGEWKIVQEVVLYDGH